MKRTRFEHGEKIEHVFEMLALWRVSLKKKRKKKESLKKRKRKKMDWVGSSTLRVRFGTIYLVKTKIFVESTIDKGKN